MRARARHKLRGWTIVEALVAVLMLGIGIAGALGAMSQLTKNERLARRSNAVVKLAHEKYDEIIATHDYTNAPINGDFSDRNVPGLTWELSLEPAGVENLNRLTLIVREENEDWEHKLEGLVYTPPTDTGGAN